MLRIPKITLLAGVLSLGLFWNAASAIAQDKPDIKHKTKETAATKT